MAERSWTIGSLPDCDIRVESPTVSGKHCRLTQRGESFLLEDLGSSNGTFVAGELLASPRIVRRSDPVTLGRNTPLPWPPSVVSITIGRLSDNDVVIPLDTISGHHARIDREGDKVYLIDLGSSNGTAINDPLKKITHNELQPTDFVFLGTHRVAALDLLKALPAPAPRQVTAMEIDRPEALERELSSIPSAVNAPSSGIRAARSPSAMGSRASWLWGIGLSVLCLIIILGGQKLLHRAPSDSGEHIVATLPTTLQSEKARTTIEAPASVPTTNASAPSAAVVSRTEQSMPLQSQPTPTPPQQPSTKKEQSQVSAEPAPKSGESSPDHVAADAPSAQQSSAIDVFFHEYEEALEDINGESDPVKQEELCRNATKRLDDRLRYQTWQFNCLIQKIEPLPNRLFDISHEAPDEVDLIPDGWTVLDKAASLPLLQLANKQQIFAGDYIVYLGTPRFDTVLADGNATNRRGEFSDLTTLKRVKPISVKQVPDTKYFYCTIEIGGVSYNQTVHLTNANVKFIKGSENLAKVNSDQDQQQPLPQQISTPQQQVLAQSAPYSKQPPAAASGGDEYTQVNNYYSAGHPYYLSPEWLAFYRVHHFHHVHERHLDIGNSPATANSTAAAMKTQKTSSVTAKTPTKQPLKQTQPK